MKNEEIFEEKLIELSNIPGIEIKIDTMWLLKKTMRENINSADIMIRILAIENYYQKNDYGFELYRRMQTKRVKQIREIPRFMEAHEEEFKQLIKSFEENGFKDECPLELNKNFEVFDGAHRLAAAIYFGIPKVSVKFSEKYYHKEYDYSLEWFKENGLEDFVPYILKKYNEIFDI